MIDVSFSALQRAEIAEILPVLRRCSTRSTGFSALQRAEIAEILKFAVIAARSYRFSALQRAEIAEIFSILNSGNANRSVSVLFNEPKLLK